LHMHNYQEFKVAFEKTQLVADVLPADTKPNVLIIHGAGTADRARYSYIREPLAADGVPTATFDQIGHGDTGGELIGSSLIARTEQALAVIHHLKLSQPLGILGASMGAYTAVRITQYVTVDRLVLFVPGVFHRDAYQLPFGNKFSEKIREPQSWHHSDAFEILAGFTGKLLIVAAEEDTVVPAEIPQRLYESAVNAKHRELFVTPNAPHRIREYLIDPTNRDLFGEVYKKVKDTLTK